MLGGGPQPSTPSSLGPIVCWGETLWDLYPKQRFLGGCAANVAIHITQLGFEARLVSRVGADELGTAARAELGCRGLDINAVQIDPSAPTGSVQVYFEDNQPKYRLAELAAWDRIELTVDVARELKLAPAVVYGTLAQRTPLSSTQLRAALELAARAVRLCDLNVRHPYATPEAIELALQYATAVKLNATEAQVLRDLYAIRDVPEWLLARGIKLVALTLDEHGSELYTPQQRLVVPAFPLGSGFADAVGAGDAYSAVLAVHLALGSSLEIMGAAASRYASAVVAQRGATPHIAQSVVDAVKPSRS